MNKLSSVNRNLNWVELCTAILPCHNEAATIGNVVTGVRAHLPTVIVVDDGSTDGTAGVAANAGAKVIRLPHQSGKGAALRAGWQDALDRGFTWAFHLDGDGQHAPDDMPSFFARAEQTHAAMLVGTRMGRSGAIPWLRREVNRWMTRRLSRLVGVPLADSQCGFRLLNLHTIRRVTPASNHFEIESELLVLFLAAGCRVEFVPVQVIYHSRGSKIHPLLDSWRWLRWWFAQRRLPVTEPLLAVPPRMIQLPETHA